MRTGFAAIVLCAALAAGIANSAPPVTSDETSIEQSCNVVPLMACGNPLPNPASAHWLYGYSVYAPMIMRLGVPGGEPLRPADVLLIKLPGGWGPDWISQNSAGGYNGCLSRGSSIQRQRGNKIGAVAQGLDTRFGTYLGPMSGSQAQYPPDVVTTQTQVTINKEGIVEKRESLRIIDYSSYETALKARQYTNAPPRGQFNRRILSMPVGDCSGSSQGSSSIPIIGFACFFLLQEPIYRGNTLWLMGQFVWHCNADGTPASNRAAIGQAHASTQKNLPVRVQADLDAVDSMEEEVAHVEDELSEREQRRTFLLQRLQEARTRDENCAAAKPADPRSNMGLPIVTLASGNGLGPCSEHILLETPLKDVEAQISVLKPRYAELQDKLSKLRSRLGEDK